MRRLPLLLVFALLACAPASVECPTDTFDTGGDVAVPVEDPILFAALSAGAHPMLNIVVDEPPVFVEAMGIADETPLFGWIFSQVTDTETSTWVIDPVDDREYCIVVRGDGGPWRDAGCM